MTFIIDLTALLVTAIVSGILTRIVNVPFLLDSVAYLIPFIYFSSLKRGLVHKLAVVYEIGSPKDSLIEMDKYINTLKDEGADEQETQRADFMQRKLRTDFSWFDALKDSTKERLEESRSVRMGVHDLNRMSGNRLKRVGRSRRTVVYCQNRSFNESSLSAYDIESGLVVQEAGQHESIVATLLLLRLLSRNVMIGKARLKLVRFLMVSSDTIRAALSTMFDELFDADFSIWLSTDDIEIKNKKVTEITWHVTGWEAQYAQRIRMLLELDLEELEFQLAQYPNCEIRSLYLTVLRGALEHCQFEEKLRIGRNELARLRRLIHVKAL